MKRNFCIGGNWLYYKIYTGVKTADIVLLEKLYPVIEELKAESIINKWFFIRYKDPHEHLRIRFYNEDAKVLPIIITRLYPVLNELLEQDIVWKIQTDTYQREMERYGAATMEDSETLFWFDSEMILNYLLLKPLFVKEEIPLLFSVLSIDGFLNAFLLTDREKVQLMDELQLSFKKEFSADKTLKKEMDVHYRGLSQDIRLFLTDRVMDEYSEITAIIQGKQQNINAICLSVRDKMKFGLSDFLKSHIHMMINRQYTSRQRMYELIIYDHLYRYYKTTEYKPKHIKAKSFEQNLKP